MNTPTTPLRPGQTIILDGMMAEVCRVTDCAITLLVQQPTRTFTTIFGKTITVRPKAKIVRISPTSQIQPIGE